MDQPDRAAPLPHWNWLDGQEIDLWCYYSNADEVELFINGRSQGTRRKSPAFGGVSGGSPYHVMWRVKFEPGEVKVVSRRGAGSEVADHPYCRTA